MILKAKSLHVTYRKYDSLNGTHVIMLQLHKVILEARSKITITVEGSFLAQLVHPTGQFNDLGGSGRITVS